MADVETAAPATIDVEMAPAAAAPATIDVEMAPAAAAKTSEDSGPTRAQRRSERRMKNSITSESLPQRDDPQTSIAAAPATVDVENTGRERAATEPADVATRNRAAVERAHKASHGTRKSMGPLSSLVKVASRRIAESIGSNRDEGSLTIEDEASASSVATTPTPRASNPRASLRRQNTVEDVKKKVRRLSLATEKIEDLEQKAKRAVRASLTSCASVAPGGVGGDVEAGAIDEPVSPGGTQLSRRSSEAEPEIERKEDIAIWVAWAKRQAEMHQHFVHPRIKVLEKSLDPSRATSFGSPQVSPTVPWRGLGRQSSTRNTTEADGSGKKTLAAGAVMRSVTRLKMPGMKKTVAISEPGGGAGGASDRSLDLSPSQSGESPGGARPGLGRLGGEGSPSPPGRLDRSTSVGDLEFSLSFVPRPLPLSCSHEDLSKILGVGVRLYFDLLRLLLGLGILGTLFSIPSFIAAAHSVQIGAYAGESPASRLGFPGFTALASLGTRTQELDSTWHDPLNSGAHLGCTDSTCEALDIATAVCEVIFVLLCFFCVRSFRAYARTLAALDQEENVRVEDYSIQIYGLSGCQSVSPQSVRHHVESSLLAYAQARVKYYETKRAYYISRHQVEPRASEKHSRLPRLANVYKALTEKWQSFLKNKCYKVADVTLIVRDRGLLRRLVGLAPVEAKLPTLKRKIDIAKQLGKKTKSLEKQLSKAEDKLKKKRAIVDKIAASPLRPMGAFVTFEWERARHVALDLWRPRSFLEFWYTQPSFAQFPVDGPPKDAANAGGGGRGRTSTAASRSDPSVADSEDGRQSSPVAARSSASTSVASEAEAAGAEESRPRAATTVASTGSGRRQPIKAYAAPRPQDVRYENLASRFAISTKARRCCADLVLLLIIILGMVVCLTAVTAKNSADYFAGELLRITNLTTTAQEYSSGVSAILPLPTPDGLLNGTSMMAPTVSSIESCPDEYNQLIRTELLNDPIGYIIRLTRNQEDSVETEAERIQLLVALLSCSLVPTMKILNTFIIVILNLAISLVIRKLVAFSRFDSLTMLHRSIVIRLAVAQFINTALVLFIVNMATGPSSITAGHVAENHVCIFGDPSDSAGGFSSVFACVAGPNGLLLRGAHFDLSPRWYADVGASLVFTLAVTLCTRNLSSLGLALLYVTKKWCLAGRVRHVEAMKALYTGPRPTLDVLLGKTYAYAAITLIFSTCLPVLYPMLVLYIGVGYCIDKWYLLRICRTPVPYGTSFVHATLWWVQYALILKLALAVWAFGSMPGMLVSDALASLAMDLKSDNSTTTFATTLMKVQALGGKGWLSQRIVTVSSVLLAVGLCLVILLKLLTLIFDHGAKVLSERIVALFSVCCGGGEKQLWPSEYPPFSKVLHGGAPSHRVRVLKRADELGRGEVLALESDIDPSPCRNCVGPLQLLLYLFGIRTFRYKLKSRADFELLKPKANLLVGRANMSYAPIFMPDYAAAFAYGNEDLAGAAADQDYGLPTALSGFL